MNDQPEKDTTKKTVSKSQRVRDFLEQHPEARNRDVAEALASHGVRAADVANVKANLKKKAGKAKVKKVSRSAATPKAAAATSTEPATVNASVPLDLLDRGIEFVRVAGGLNEAQHLLNVIKRIKNL